MENSCHVTIPQMSFLRQFFFIFGLAVMLNFQMQQKIICFNQALADHSNMTNPRLIDGIVLTKFDTIDDKVS
jgi:hypothetical protein